MASFVQVTAFAPNPDPGVVGQGCMLNFDFQNIGDQPTPDDHGVEVAVTDPALVTTNLGLLNVTMPMDSSHIHQTGMPFTPQMAGAHQVTATADEGGVFEATFQVV